MGGKFSSEAGGVNGCSGCGVRLPPANPFFDFVKACEDTPMLTYCFYTPAENPIVFTSMCNVGINGETYSAKTAISFQVKKGERLFKYFRMQGNPKYWCSKCFARNHPKTARPVLLELSDKGKVVTAEMELIKMG